MNEFREQVEKMDKNIEKLKKDRDKFIKDFQAKCKHPPLMIRETPQTPPFRVCMECGYAEQGWGCGYWKLDHVPYDEVAEQRNAIKYVLGRVHSQEELSERFSRRKDS